MSEDVRRPVGDRRLRRRRVVRGAGGLVLAASAGAGGFFAVAGGASTAATTAAVATSATNGPMSMSPGIHALARPAVVGSVQSVDAANNTFTVKDLSGTTTTVTVSSTTTYREPGTSTASLADLKAGTQVAVIGTSAAGSVSATTVLIGFRGDGDGPGRGPLGFPGGGMGHRPGGWGPMPDAAA